MDRKSIVTFFLTLVLNGNGFAQEILFDLKGPANYILENTGFELSEVLNTQEDITLIGRIYNTHNQLSKAKIKSGLADGIKTFYRNSVKKTDSFWAIQLRILEFKIIEKQHSSKVASGELKIKFSYFLKTSFEPIHLVDYEAGITYKRSISQTHLAKEIVNRGLGNSLVFFNDWIIENAPKNILLAKNVQLEIVEKKYKSDQDTVFYEQNRKLIWDDFRESPNRTSRFNAAIFTSFAIEGAPFMKEGVLIVPIEIKVYMLPESSWVKSIGKNDYSLNHEQKHFDITRIIGNRLINRLKTMQVNLENYEATVNDAFFDTYREMNRLQEIYDDRTKHGLDKDAQSLWDEIINRALNGNMEEIEAELKKGK